MADYNPKVTDLQRQDSDLQSELAPLNRESSGGEPSPSPGISDFKRWMRENSVNANKVISVPDPSTYPSDIHHRLAHNALVHLRSKDWSSAHMNARKVNLHSCRCTYFHSSTVQSIENRPSAMGYIAKAVAQLRMSEPEKADQVFDFAFANCHPDESDFLLVIKVCDPYAGKSLIHLSVSPRPLSYLWLGNVTLRSRVFVTC